MSLVGTPPIIFLDEPTTGLDPEARIEVWKMVKELADGGKTVFLTTQYLEEAEQLADHIAILHEGKIIASGTLVELKKLFPPAKVEYVEKQPTLEEIFLAIIGGQKGRTNRKRYRNNIFQRSERDAWSFHAPYFPQHGHHHHGHDHAYCVYVAVRVCVRRRNSNRDSELCELLVTRDLTDCDCERDILYGFPFVYRCATGHHSSDFAPCRLPLPPCCGDTS